MHLVGSISIDMYIHTSFLVCELSYDFTGRYIIKPLRLASPQKCGTEFSSSDIESIISIPAYARALLTPLRLISAGNPALWRFSHMMGLRLMLRQRSTRQTVIHVYQDVLPFVGAS